MPAKRFMRRVFHDTGGQVLWFGVILAIALLGFMLAIANGTRAVTQKTRAQTSADAGAYSGSVWLARSLNLSANLNIGIRSIYTWMTVLTVGEALAQALCSDTLDASVKTTGQNIATALFGNSDPVSVHSNEYKGAIGKLDTATQWLYSLQSSIATNFTQVAARMGSNEASLDIGGSSQSLTAGGWTLVRTNDTLPLLDTNHVGDSLLYANLSQYPARLDTLPTNDSNIGPAYGRVIISPTTWDVWAYYSDTSKWYDRVDTCVHLYSKCVIQVFIRTPQISCVGGYIDTIIEYRDNPGSWQNSYIQGDSWGHWVWYCGEPGGNHTPVIWPNGVGKSPYKNSPPWTFLSGHPSSNCYKRDTVWTSRHLAKKLDTAGMGSYKSPAESTWLAQHGDQVGSHRWVPTGFYTGAESTVPIKGPRVRPRRVNPNREFHTVAYVWHQGAASSPYGLGPALGKALFPRGSVAAPSPLFSVARAVPFLPSTVSDYFFQPGWDVKLTALDSVGVATIMGDTAYASRTQNCFSNLQNLRKYVLLP